MRFWHLGKRNLKEFLRDRVGMFFLFFFPAFFLLIFGLAFRDGVGEISLGIIDEDQTPISSAFQEILKQNPALTIWLFDTVSEAEEKIRMGEIVGFVHIPSGFGEATMKWKMVGGNIPLTIGYDPTSPWTAPHLFAHIDSAVLALFQIELPLELEVKEVFREVENPFLQWVTPGLIVFGLMILLPTAAGIMVKDKQTGFLSRLLTTPTRPRDFLFAYSLPLVLLSIVQVAFYLVVASLLGVKIIGSLPLAYLLYLVFGISTIGMGMILATFVKTAEQAQGLSWFLLVPLATISGVWFPTEGLPSYMRAFAHLFPFHYATEASRDIIVRGLGWEAVSGEFLVLIIWALAAFTIGALLFRRVMVR
ncbi:ABC transporter permease [Dehalococcoidales bacterium]|nr:ABC transporter permease [Dehalococcoidales bacterium]